MRPGPAVAQSIQVALAGMSGLEAWDEMQAFAERCVDALRGGEGLSRSDLTRISRWPARWAAAGDPLRAFYKAATEADLNSGERAAVHYGLRAILDGRHPDDWVRGRLARLHVDLLGTDAGIVLCPTNLGFRPTTVTV